MASPPIGALFAYKAVDASVRGDAVHYSIVITACRDGDRDRPLCCAARLFVAMLCVVCHAALQWRCGAVLRDLAAIILLFLIRMAAMVGDHDGGAFCV
jgi:hypothetical protein